MASRHCASSLRGARRAWRCRVAPEPSIDPIQRTSIRTLATATAAPPSQSEPISPDLPLTTPPPPPPAPTARRSNGLIIPSQIPHHILPTPQIHTTIHSFPSLEPLSYTSFPHTHLAVPLRRDILHKAIVYEGDSSRQGTASTKYRSEIHGSGRKIRPQKGSGHARLGDKKSPMLRGGGVAQGPKPRSFATDLPRKVYDKAWRMALSYRWRRGQLVVVDKLDIPSPWRDDERSAYWLRWVLDGLGWGRNGQGHSFFITAGDGSGSGSGSESSARFAQSLDMCERYGRHRVCEEVDVKNLLEMQRLVVERQALWKMLFLHQSDLKMPLVGHVVGQGLPPRAADVHSTQTQAQAQAGLGSAASSALSDAAGVASAAAAIEGINALSMDEVNQLATEHDEEQLELDEEDGEGIIEAAERELDELEAQDKQH